MGNIHSFDGGGWAKAFAFLGIFRMSVFCVWVQSEKSAVNGLVMDGWMDVAVSLLLFVPIFIFHLAHTCFLFVPFTLTSNSHQCQLARSPFA